VSSNTDASESSGSSTGDAPRDLCPDGSEGRAYKVFAGGNSTCVLLCGRDGAVCWGDNASGQFGGGNEDILTFSAGLGGRRLPPGYSEADPVFVVDGLATPLPIVDIALGDGLRCFLVDNDGNSEEVVHCAGNPDANGAGSGIAAGGFVEMGLGASNKVIELTTTDRRTCALADSGQVQCWGWAGDQPISVDRILSPNAPLGHVSTASYYDPDENDFFLGNNETPGSAGVFPARSPFPTSIMVGAEHTCGVVPDNGVHCWGAGSNGVLGTGTQNLVAEFPVTANNGVLDSGDTLVQWEAGKFHSCAVVAPRGEENRLRCWGRGQLGVLGSGGTANANGGASAASFVHPSFSDGQIPVEVRLGDENTCVRFDNGAIRCWGHAIEGRIGAADNDATDSAASPVYYDQPTAGAAIGDDTLAPVHDVPLGEEAIQFALGGAHGCALLVDGNVRCWGRSAELQTGYAFLATPRIEHPNVGGSRVIDCPSPASAGNVPYSDWVVASNTECMP
ncbi:MAG: hypothetical protein JKY37_17180, partial [Nannocystaceae bacterium]|nr:hypothetical protein [Nannocystaceae bacterium]